MAHKFYRRTVKRRKEYGNLINIDESETWRINLKNYQKSHSLYFNLLFKNTSTIQLNKILFIYQSTFFMSHSNVFNASTLITNIQYPL